MSLDDRIVRAIREGDYEEAARLEESRQCRRLPLVAGGQGRSREEVEESARVLALLVLVGVACIIGLAVAAAWGCA